VEPARSPDRQRQRSGSGHMLVERDLEHQITGTLKTAVHSERTIRREVRTFPMCPKSRGTRPAMVRWTAAMGRVTAGSVVSVNVRSNRSATESCHSGLGQ
jgi:hypothetical protein